MNEKRKKMKKHRAIALSWWVFTCCMVLLTVWQFVQTEQKAKYLVSEAFGNAIEREKNLRQPDIVYSFPANLNECADSLIVESDKGLFSFQRMDSLSLSDRWKWTYQCYLLMEYPSRANFLDSLFQDLLSKEHMRVCTAVSTLQGDSLISCSNAELCHPRYEMDSVNFGSGNGKITLKSYASFSPGYLLGRAYPVWIILAVWMAATLLFYVYRKKKKQVQMAIPPAITFNPQSGLLKNGEREVYLKKNRLSIFTALWEAPDHFCSHEVLCRISGRPLRADGKENRSIKSSLKQAIQLLKGDLKAFPELQIVNQRGSGYQLLIQ